MTLRTALLQGVKLLDDAGIAEPRLTAEVLLAHAVSHDRPWLTAHASDELSEIWWIHYGRYLHQRIEGKPTQYITGKQEFYGREFRVTPDVLIPRPETEHLIEAALSALSLSQLGVTEPRAPASGQILDVGTGSGAIAITLALETNAQVTATDISPAALEIARANAERLGASVRFLECDLIPEGRTYDLIVSNPPYVALADKPTLQREVRDHEPELALYAGPDGLEVYRRLIPLAQHALNPSGRLILEIGSTQAESVSAMLASWTDVNIVRDMAGHPRVICARSST